MKALDENISLQYSAATKTFNILNLIGNLIQFGSIIYIYIYTISYRHYVMKILYFKHIVYLYIQRYEVFVAYSIRE